MILDEKIRRQAQEFLSSHGIRKEWVGKGLPGVVTSYEAGYRACLAEKSEREERLVSAMKEIKRGCRHQEDKEGCSCYEWMAEKALKEYESSVGKGET